ncbi:MAG: hypothetical protein AVO38_10920 [delta proteobacterium ML8_D]|nr:MAG: hypothetical protein AVO34_05315 [Firmicutes bacterium ML8_F2]OPL15099.1 MAG: hypothetical protein AVO38_10920 [delta proteobacterium ML8_D]
MNINLSNDWVLTDEHPSSSYKQPVLVKHQTKEAFAAGDLLRLTEQGGFHAAYTIVWMLVEDLQLSKSEQRFVEKFIW